MFVNQIKGIPLEIVMFFTSHPKSTKYLLNLICGISLFPQEPYGIGIAIILIL